MRRLLLSIAFTMGACTDLSGLSATPTGADAGTDGSAVPPAPSDDAGSDAVAATDADAGSCPGDFCEGFDNKDFRTNWTDQIVIGGTADLDTAIAKAPPSSLHVQTPTGTGATSNERTFVVRKYLSVGKSLSCSFWFRTEAAIAGSVNFLDFFALEMTAPSQPDYVLRLAMESGRTSLREDVGPCDPTTCPRKIVALPDIAPAVWRHVELATDFTSATVRYDDTVVYTGAFVGFTPTTLAIRVGAQNFTNAAADVHFDDLVCTVGK